HRDLGARGIVADLVHHVGRLQRPEAAHVDVDAGFGDTLFPHRMFGDALDEGFARHQTLAHRFQRAFGGAHRANAVGDAAWTEAALRYFEAASFAQDQVFGRHFHVLKQDFSMAVRRIVEAEDWKHALDLHARRVGFDQDLRLLAVLVGRWV